MNKTIVTLTSLFIAAIRPSGSIKTVLILKLLKGKHFITNLKELYFTKIFNVNANPVGEKPTLAAFKNFCKNERVGCLRKPESFY